MKSSILIALACLMTLAKCRPGRQQVKHCNFDDDCAPGFICIKSLEGKSFESPVCARSKQHSSAKKAFRSFPAKNSKCGLGDDDCDDLAKSYHDDYVNEGDEGDGAPEEKDLFDDNGEDEPALEDLTPAKDSEKPSDDEEENDEENDEVVTDGESSTVLPGDNFKDFPNGESEDIAANALGGDTTEGAGGGVFHQESGNSDDEALPVLPNNGASEDTTEISGGEGVFQQVTDQPADDDNEIKTLDPGALGETTEALAVDEQGDFQATEQNVVDHNEGNDADVAENDESLHNGNDVIDEEILDHGDVSQMQGGATEDEAEAATDISKMATDEDSTDVNDQLGEEHGASVATTSADGIEIKTGNYDDMPHELTVHLESGEEGGDHGCDAKLENLLEMVKQEIARRTDVNNRAFEFLQQVLNEVSLREVY